MRGVATEIEIHAKELERTRQKINELIAEETGVSDILNLPATKVFKIRAQFDV